MFVSGVQWVKADVVIAGDFVQFVKASSSRSEVRIVCHVQTATRLSSALALVEIWISIT